MHVPEQLKGVCMRVRARVCACVRACVYTYLNGRACVCVCVCVHVPDSDSCRVRCRGWSEAGLQGVCTRERVRARRVRQLHLLRDVEEHAAVRVRGFEYKSGLNNKYLFSNYVIHQH